MKRIINTLSQKWPEYLLEILVLIIGIYGAFAVDNWNENRKEQAQQTELINLLITDIQGKVRENSSDYRRGLNMTHTADTVVQVWKKTNTLDTTYLKRAIEDMGADYGYTSRSSPIYTGIANSDLWKKLPDTLTRKADVYYREALEAVHVSFQKYSDYAYENKINFLTPNDLLDLDRPADEILRLLDGKEEIFIRNLKLTRGGISTLVSRWKSAIDKGNELIIDLEAYNKSK